MTKQDAQALADRMDADQTHEAFRDMAKNVAIYYRELRRGGVPKRAAKEWTADLQSVYACKMLGVEL